MNKIMKIKLLVCTLFLLCMSVWYNIPNKPTTEEILYKNIIIKETVLITEVQNYLNKNAPKSKQTARAIVRYAMKYDFDIPLLLSQGLCESHFASYGVGKRTNNTFNVGNYDNGIKLYKYNHPDESIEPYIKLILSSYLVNKTVEELLKNYVNVYGKRFASAPDYENKIKSTRNNIIKNTKITELQIEIKNLKHEIGL